MTIEITGADFEEPGPRGLVARFLRAAAAKDQEAAAALLTEGSRDGFSVNAAPPIGAARVGEAVPEEDAVVVEVELEAEGESQTMPFVVVEEGGESVIDLDATMSRLLGFSPMEMLEEMGDALASGFEEIGEGLAKAMEAGFGPSGDEPDPDRPPPEREREEEPERGPERA